MNFLRDNESKTLLTLDKNMVHFYTVHVLNDGKREEDYGTIMGRSFHKRD